MLEKDEVSHVNVTPNYIFFCHVHSFVICNIAIFRYTLYYSHRSYALACCMSVCLCV